jgi:hypothetical protein
MVSKHTFLFKDQSYRMITEVNMILDVLTCQELCYKNKPISHQAVFSSGRGRKPLSDAILVYPLKFLTHPKLGTPGLKTSCIDNSKEFCQTSYNNSYSRIFFLTASFSDIGFLLVLDLNKQSSEIRLFQTRFKVKKLKALECIICFVKFKDEILTT